MRCPACGCNKSVVLNSRRVDTDDWSMVRRTRGCPACGATWWTFEEWDKGETGYSRRAVDRQAYQGK